MSLYLLNISVDAADPAPEHIPEDLSFNEQESIIELVVEKLLGFENAIEEYDDYDSEDYIKKKNFNSDWLSEVSSSRQKTIHIYISRVYPNTWHELPLANGFYEINSPPPIS